MIFNQENKKLAEDITDFLKKRSNGKNYVLWEWAIKVPIENRINELFQHNVEMKNCLENNKKFIDKGSVLDLGCGFCAYWPFLEKIGFTEFVGFDLYSTRGQGSQEYMITARDLVQNFCKKSNFIIVEDDVRFIQDVKNRKPSYYSSQDFNQEFNKFDLIFTKNTDYQKMGSTGIPESIFNEICLNYLKDRGNKIYNG